MPRQAHLPDMALANRNRPMPVCQAAELGTALGRLPYNGTSVKRVAYIDELNRHWERGGWSRAVPGARAYHGAIYRKVGSRWGIE